MTPETFAIRRAAALEYANAVIRKFGGTPQPDLSKGVAEERTCPLALTILAGLPDAPSVRVRPANGDVLIIPTLTSEPVTLPLSADARNFAIDFDEGLHPDLRDFTADGVAA